MKTSTDARDAELDTLTTLLDGGFMKIFTGAQPISPESAETGILLATLEFNKPAFASASGGQAVANPITEDTDAAATGNAGWFRCYKSDGKTAIVDGTVGTGDSDINLRSIAIQKHSEVAISGFAITLPE